jgi:hypothetical protein
MLFTNKLFAVALVFGFAALAAGCSAETGSVGPGAFAPVSAGGGHDESRSDFPKAEKKHDLGPGPSRVSVGGDPNASFSGPLGKNPRARRF